MKLCTFEVSGMRSIGIETNGQMLDLPAACGAMVAARGPKTGGPGGMPADMLAFLRLGEPALKAARDTLAFMARRPALPVGLRASYLLDEACSVKTLGSFLVPPRPVLFDIAKCDIKALNSF